MRIYRDRTDGGQELAKHLEAYRSGDTVVYGLPRGGAVTASVVAQRLGAPLDLIVACKIGHPGNPEYALGAITDDGDVALNEHDLDSVSREWVEAEEAKQRLEAQRRRDLYLAGRVPMPVEGKVAILVDDGIATGYTMEAAVLSVRRRRPSKIVVAAPVATSYAARKFAALADEVVLAQAPDLLYAIGQWYEDFSPVEDGQVLDVMKEAGCK